MKIGKYEVAIIARKMNDEESRGFRKDTEQFLKDLYLALWDTVQYNESQNWPESLKRHEEWLEDVSNRLSELRKGEEK